MKVQVYIHVANEESVLSELCVFADDSFHNLYVCSVLFLLLLIWEANTKGSGPFMCLASKEFLVRFVWKFISVVGPHCYLYFCFIS